MVTVTSFFASSQKCVYMHPSVCMRVLILILSYSSSGVLVETPPLPIRARVCAFALWVFVCARGRSRSHLQEAPPKERRYLYTGIPYCY